MGLLDWSGMAATCLLAALLLAANGFGFALLAVPGLLLFAPPREVVPLVVIVSIAVLAIVVPRVHAAIDRPLLLRLGLGAGAGVPLGLLALRWADPVAVRAFVGAAVLLFAVLLALRRRRRWPPAVEPGPGRDLAVGAAAGVTTALAGISGPPVVVYMMLTEVPARTLRATLLAFFMLCYVAALLAEAVAVGVPAAVWRMAAALTPFAWVGGVLGRRLGDRLGAEAAGALALAVLAAAGAYTLLAALWRAFAAP